MVLANAYIIKVWKARLKEFTPIWKGLLKKLKKKLMKLFKYTKSTMNLKLF